MTPIREEARAKVNLTLKVRGRRADGYHDLESLIVFASGAADEVVLYPGEPPGLVASGAFARAVEGPNLIETTLARLNAAAPDLRLGRVELQKRLPVAAGLGGGSADAAALLRAVLRANPGSSGDWSGIAASLGADVPVCLLNRPALVWAVGERMVPVEGLPPIPAVLANALAPVPPDKTARVFRALAAPAAPATREPEPPSLADLASLADLRAVVDFMRAQGNDLLGPAQTVLPAIAPALEALRGAPGCLHAALSGAGPTCVGVFASGEQAAEAAQDLKRAQPGWWIVPAVLG
jgi:4-diphosphocytidyl-2-C-methyl-D-erythritol kinase